MPLYFIGIVAPEEINSRVMEWKHYMFQHFGCKVALRSPAHVTLIPPFTLKTEHEPQLEDDIREFASIQLSFNIQLNNFSSFPPRVIFVGVDPTQHLTSIQENIEQYLINKNYRIKKSTRPFHPHITIANRDLRKEDYRTAFNHFKSISFKASFRATHVDVLVSRPEGWVMAAHISMQTFDM